MSYDTDGFFGSGGALQGERPRNRVAVSGSGGPRCQACDRGGSRIRRRPGYGTGKAGGGQMRSSILITYNNEDAIEEATLLCEAAGYRVDHVIRQDRLLRPKYGVSEEIIDRLEDVARRIRPDVIVYDELLRPSQNYNLASKLHRNVLDRESLILEIFEGRASSAESKLQVKLAQMRYEMGRAKEKVRLAKMGEQPGFMGIGKFEVDSYHDDIRHRMQTVRKKLEKAGKQRELHRRGRKRQGLRTVSLAGYTSAGKTTLFNALTGEQKEEDDKLFTTLSTTVRRMEAAGEAILVSDTVGFISKLPAYMIDAFKSTLEELLYSDVVVLVVDVSDAPTHLRKKFRSCKRTIDELGVDRDRLVLALNKSDLTTEQDIGDKMEELGLGDTWGCVVVSARTGDNLDGLRRLIRDVIGGREAGREQQQGQEQHGHRPPETGWGGEAGGD